MKQLNTTLVFVFSLFVLLGCDTKPTLQTYFVDHQEAPNFISMDVPISFLGVNDIQVTKTQKEAINSIDKLNMLGYSLKSGSLDIYNEEVAKIKTLLKGENYNELMRLGNPKEGKIKISYTGDDDAMDELIVFGESKEFGFAIIRVLGDGMNVSKIMELGPIINKLDTKKMNVDGFLDFML
jgi:hypothetical protein